MLWLGAGAICPLFAGLAILAAASALLRIAVVLANRAIGPVNKDAPIGWDWDADEDDELVEPPGESAAIPEPSLGVGMFIVFLAAVAHVVAGFGLRFVLALDNGWNHVEDNLVVVAAHLLGISAGFLVMMAFLASLLPTTPKRAALTALLFHLLLLAFGVTVAVILFALRVFG